jgi:hypothetical protein
MIRFRTIEPKPAVNTNKPATMQSTESPPRPEAAGDDRKIARQRPRGLEKPAASQRQQSPEATRNRKPSSGDSSGACGSRLPRQPSGW